jgi:hypothetical protein
VNRCKWKRLGDRRALCLVGLEQIKSLRACDGASPIARVCRSSASIINEKSDVQAPSDTTCGGFHSFLTIRSLYIDIDFMPASGAVGHGAAVFLGLQLARPIGGAGDDGVYAGRNWAPGLFQRTQVWSESGVWRLARCITELVSKPSLQESDNLQGDEPAAGTAIIWTLPM